MTVEIFVFCGWWFSNRFDVVSETHFSCDTVGHELWLAILSSYPGLRGFSWYYFTAWRSCERAAKRRERKTSGYFGLESHFHADASCQSVKLIIQNETNGSLAITCLSAANVSTRVVRSGIFWPTWPGSMCVFARLFSIAKVNCLLNILRSKYLHFSFCKKASGLPNRKA